MKRRARRLALLLLGWPLVGMAGGCGSQNSGVWFNYLQLMRESLHASLGDSAVTRAQAAAVPYASLGYRINGSRESLLVLATDENGEQMWTSASHVVLNFRDGRLVRTVGLPHDSAQHPARGDTQPSVSQALKSTFRSARLVDMPDRGVYSVPLLCTATAGVPQTVIILGTALATRRVDETCSSSYPRWSFTDSYWIDSATGFVWRSIQHPHPAITIETEILRPPG